MSTERITARFKMARAVLDDTETAALEAANAHTFQLDGLSKQVAALTQENGELALEAARLRKQRNPNRTVVSNKDKVDDAGWVEAVATAIGLYYEYDGPFVAAESNVVVERIEQLKADSVRLRHLANLDMMSLQMPDGFVAETIEQALRGWKAGYDEAVAEVALGAERMDDVIAQRAAAQLEAREARAELRRVREQLASTLCVIEKATTEAANAVVYANVDTSLSDPKAGKLLVVRLSDDDANSFAHKPLTATFWTEQFVGWLEAAQDEGDTETRDVHHEGLPMPVVRCGECTSVNGHFGDCAKAVQP